MRNIIVVNFEQGRTEASAYNRVWQYDYGQTLRIQGLKLPRNVEIHFATQRTGGIALPRVGVTRDGVTDVVIPDSMLENGDATSDYPVYAFVYLTDETSGQTEYMIRMQIKSRPRPEVPGGSEDPGAFHEAVQEVRKLTEKATESERQAEGWAHGREDLPERAEDNAKYYAEKASEDAKKTTADRTAVESMVQDVTQMQGDVERDLEQVQKLAGQAQTSATNAALSEQAAKASEIAAQEAQVGAETAEGQAERFAGQVAADKAAVELIKSEADKTAQKIAEDKNTVQGLVDDFTLAHQQAVEDVNNAGQTQTERVENAGETAVYNIETSRQQAVESVSDEGTTQKEAVKTEGTTQIENVQAAAEEIIADRKQIAENKNDITDLKGDILKLSSTVVNDKFGDYYEVPLTFENSYLLDTGLTSDYDEASTSNYEPVVPGETIIVSAQFGYHTKSVCFYNASKNKTSVYPENRVEAIESYDEQEFTVPDDSYYVRVSSCFTTSCPTLKKKNNEKAYKEIKDTTNALQNEMESPYYEYQKYDVSIVDGFIVKENGNVSEYGTSKVTDFIEMIPDDVFYITADAQYQSAVIGLYDSSNAKVATFGYNADTSYYIWNDELNISTLLKQYPTAKYFKVSSLNGDKLSVQVKVTSSIWDVIARTKESNVLYRKKYVACGDSFTHATYLSSYVDEDGNTGTESKAYDKNMSMYKSYAWWIAHRNEMTLINEAHDGSMMHSVNNSVLCFSEERYKLIPKDAEYITLAFGLNDDLPQDNAVYGDKTSTDITTIWGAWNTVLEYLITNIPKAKIGIIINDGWMSENMRNAEIEIAEYWGIPYLDLAGGENVPLMIGGKVGSTVSEKAKALRTSQYSTAENNQHPNYDAHIMRSTIIEAWMRSMDGCGHAKHKENSGSSGKGWGQGFTWTT